MKLLLWSAVISCVFSLPVFAKKKKSKKSQIAIVQVDGAAVYKVPNFDSPIIAYLNKGRKIRASKKIYPGIGGLGSFYKVRLKRKKYGYVTDVDLFPANKKKTESSGGGDIFVPSGGDDLQGAAMGSDGSNSLFERRYIGLSYNFANYSEEILKKEYKENIGFFGLKLSGPRALLLNLPLELNLMAYFGSPQFYEKIYNKASGFILLLDVLYSVPIVLKPNYMLYVGLGPMLRYSSQQVEVTKQSNSNSVPFDVQFVNLGVSASAGLAYKLGQSLLLKGEAKYMYEEQSHIIFSGAVQLAY